MIPLKPLPCICSLYRFYPYSTQATNRHETIFLSLFRGIREVSLFFFSKRDALRASPDSDTMSLRIFGGNRLNSAGFAQEFITISKITLEHATRKLRNQLQYSQEYAKCSTNGARINRNPRRFPTIREIFSHDSYKKGPYMLQGTAPK